MEDEEEDQDQDQDENENENGGQTLAWGCFAQEAHSWDESTRRIVGVRVWGVQLLCGM